MLQLPEPVTKLLDWQFGSGARRQLIQRMPERRVDWFVERGTLEAIYRSVYRVAGGGRPVEQRAMAALLRVGTGRVSGPFMLGLYGAEGFSAATDPFVVLVPAGKRVSNVDFMMAPDLATGRHGAAWQALAATTPSLAAIDAAHPRFEIPDERLRVGVDSLRWFRRTSTERLRRLALDLPGHPGAQRLVTMFATGELVNESEAEREVDAIATSISPPPQRQVVVLPHRRVDFLWQPLWFIVEYDGDVHRSLDRRRQDETRDKDLKDRGYRVEHVTKQDLADPGQFRAWLVATLQRRARELGVNVHVRG